MEDSPAAGESSVTYKANPQSTEPVVLSGGTVITGWQPSGKLWQAKVAPGSNFRELFVNGHRRIRARTPTTGFFRIVKAGPDDRTSFTFKAGDLKRFNNLAQAEVVFLHDWSVTRVGIQDIDEKTNTVRLQAPVGRPSPYFAMTHFEKQPRYAVENALELLDSPGEWYLDSNSGVLSYWPVDGETIEKTTAVVPKLTALLVVKGDEAGGRAVRNLHFEGIRFAHCAWPLPPGGYAASQATMHSSNHTDPKSPSAMIPAAITFDAAQNRALNRCQFEHLGAAPFGFGASKNNRLSHCRIHDIAGNGVNVGEPDVAMATSDAVTAGRVLDPVSQGNAVVFNLVERCGVVFHGAVGVWVAMAKATDVSSNEISHLPYTGVSVGWNWSPAPTVCEGNLITSNHIHHVMQMLSDGAGIYTLGRQPGTVLRGNVIHDVPVNAGRAESNGIFMDEGSTEMLVESNVIYNTARSSIRFHQAGKNTLRTNQLVNKPKTPPFRYNSTDEKNIQMENNQSLEAENWTPPAGILPATATD